MNKQELAIYCSALLDIMVSKETAGRARGNTLADEYNKHYDLLLEAIRKENDEARQSADEAQRDEDRAER